MPSARGGWRCELSRLSLRQSLALWTLVPMITFSLLVLVLSAAWAWRDVLGIAEERNTDLAGVIAMSLGDHEGVDSQCRVLDELSARVEVSLYVVDENGRVVCASDRSAGVAVLAIPSGDKGAFQDRRHIISYASIPRSTRRVVLEEPLSNLAAPTFSFMVAITALMIVGLFVSFGLLWLGFYRISWPLLAVTEQARRVAAGEEFAPPDVSGPAEVEALVAAFNRMVTRLRAQRDTLQEYAKRVLHSQEEERKRISRDLHDETAQELVGLMQRIDLCRLTLEDNPRALGALDELYALAAQTLDGVRRMSRDLRPLILEDLGLVAAIQTIAEELDEQLPQARVFCEVIGRERRLPLDVELTTFRIVQEALTNVRKHAVGADRVYVTVQFKGSSLQVRVEDNGCGFYMPESLRSRGERLGLLGMQERAELIGGHLTIHSQLGEGTMVILDLDTSER